MDTLVVILGLRATQETLLLLARSCTRSQIHFQTLVWVPFCLVTELLPDLYLAFDIHEYLDSDYSGGHVQCTQPAASNLAGVTSWLKQYGFKAFITEFGASNGTQCETYLTDMVNYMANNPEYIGWTAWAAGPFWGASSPCCTDQQQWGSLEPGSKARDGSPGLYTTVWQKLIQPLLPITLQKSGIASVKPPGSGPSSSSTTKIATSTTLSTSTILSTTTTPIKVSTTTTASTTKILTTTTTTTTTTTKKPTTTATTTTSANGATQTQWGQCAGIGYTGPKNCISPWTCKYSNDWYSQCL